MARMTAASLGFGAPTFYKLGVLERTPRDRGKASPNPALRCRARPFARPRSITIKEDPQVGSDSRTELGLARGSINFPPQQRGVELGVSVHGTRVFI